MQKVKIKADTENFKIIAYSPDKKFKNMEEFIRWLQPSIPTYVDINNKINSIFRHHFSILKDNMFKNGNIVEMKLAKNNFNNENINYIKDMLYKLAEAALNISKNYNVLTEEEIVL